MRMAGLVVLLGSLGASNVWACLCADPKLSDRDHAAAAFKTARVVFEAEFVSVARRSVKASGASDLKKRFILRSLRVYKGPDRPLFAIYTALGGWDCGWNFRPGVRYLIYAYGPSLDELSTSICTRTNRVKHAEADVRFLRGEAPTPEDLLTPEEKLAREEGWTAQNTGILCGSVRSSEGKPPKGAQVTVWPAGERKVVKSGRTNEDGRFRIILLRPGRYLIGAVNHGPEKLTMFAETPPEVGFYSVGSRFEDATPVEAKAGEETCGLEILLSRQSGYTLRGSVSKRDGSPLTEEWQASLENSEGEPFRLSRLTRRQDRGRFEFRGVPPGRYMVEASSIKLWGWKGQVEIELQGDLEIRISLEPDPSFKKALR